MKKLLVVGVIVLFLGLAIAPSINANVSKASIDSELVEITTEICRLNGRKHTVQLTPKESDEVDALFDLIGEQLNVTETLEEAEKILNDAIVQLDKYGLLGGLSVKQAQRIFKVYHAIQRNIDTSGMSAKENANCIIAGRVTNAYFFGPVIRSLNQLMVNNEEMLFLILLNPLLLFALDIGFPFFPFRMGTSIALGFYTEYMLEWATYPSKGWIVTSGSNGTKKWIGELEGDIDCIDLSFVSKNLFFVGVDGFFGLKIYNPLTGKTSFLGYASKVKIEAGWLDELKHPLLFTSVILLGKSRLFRFEKLWEIVFNPESSGIFNMILLLRAVWLICTVDIWIEFWNNLSEKLNWNWRDVNGYIYY
ncbi:hypothetical protein MBGDF03_00052 [Thermoplasmatales archaeon SCGC AB-540-F20]|nr:hypothetical protein MBGDF03_00052 [Thermoplasmatales archaeon SCGC AB-540-F20]